MKPSTEIKSKRSFSKRLLGIFLYIVLVFTVLSILLITLAQFGFFRNFAVNKILSFVNKELIADIELDDITLFSPEGIKLYGVRLLTGGDTLANIPELVVHVNFEQLMNQKVSVNRLILKNPRIKLYRSSQDSIWNYDLIAAASNDTTSTEPSPWEIKVSHLEFKSADFLYYDSTSSYINLNTMDYSHLYLEQFDMIMSADIKPGKNDFAVKIRKLDAYESFSGVALTDFSAGIGISPELIYVNNLQTEIGATSVGLSVEMRNFDVFNPEKEPDIEDADFTLALKSFNVDDDLIYKFAVIPISFGSSSDVFLDAEGSLNNLSVKRLNLVTGETDLRMSGKLLNLLDTDNFVYEFSLDKSSFTRDDIIKVMRSLDLSGIPEFESAIADRMYVKGFIDSVYTDLKIRTKIGDIHGKAGINYVDSALRYFADVEVKKVNLAKFLQDAELNTSINGRIYLKGIDVNPKEMTSFIKTELYDTEILGIKFKNLQSDIHSDKGIFYLDSMNIGFDDGGLSDEEKVYIGFDESPELIANGLIDLNQPENPEFRINLDLTAIDFKSMLKIDYLPDYTSASIELSMRGLNIDSINGSMNANIHGLGFTDRAFMPFDIKADISMDSLNNKYIHFDSDFFMVELNGQFNFPELFESLTFQGQYFVDYINQKIDSFNPARLISVDSTDIAQVMVIPHQFPLIDAVLKAEFKDLSPMNLFLDSLSLYSNIQLDCRLVSDSTISSIFIDAINIEYLDISKTDFDFNTRNLNFNGRLISKLDNYNVSIENFTLNLDTTSSIILNDMSFDSLYTSIYFDGTILNYKVSSIFNKDIELYSLGKVDIKPSEINLVSEELMIRYDKLFKWTAPEPINVTSTPAGIKIGNMKIARDSAEIMELKGSIENDIANNLTLEISNLPISDFLMLADEETKEQYDGIRFNLDSLRIRVNGDLKQPRIVSSFNSDSLIFNNYQLGTLRGRIIHNHNYTHGFLDIITPQLSNRKILTLDVNYLPLFLGLDKSIPMFDSTKQLDVRLKALGLPLELVAPFAVGIRDLSGFADANIVVEGSLSDGIKYSGSAKSDNAGLRIDNTNIAYNAELEIDFDKDRINLTNVLIKNIPADSRFGRLGRAVISGYVAMNGFEIGELDIALNAERLLVMSDATMVTMPDLYGDFIISTDNQPLRFYGTLDKPNLTGDVNIIDAHLKMPLEQKKQIVRTYFTYEKIDDKVRLTSITSRDSTEQNNNNDRFSPSIADLINYDLSAKILGQFIVEMDMNLIGSMYAVIATADRTQSLRYEKKRDNPVAKLFGEVVVKEQSTIKSWKQFTAAGKINFPTGSIENPSLELTATHSGTMTDNGVRKQFIVKMKIEGTKENPDVTFTYFIDGVEASGSTEQINEDALYLLVMGRTKTGSGASTNSNLLNEGFASGVSNFATKALSDLLMGTGVINSAEFDFQGGSMNLGDATLRLSGQLYGGISWTIGGTVADLSSNNQITIDIPASEFSNNPFWSNFILQLSKASSNNVMANAQDAKNWEVKIKLGSSW